MMWFLVLLPLISATIPSPSITPLSPGIRWEIPDNDYSLVAVHFSVNSELVDVQAGQYNADITTKQGGKWVYENRAVSLNPGDKIHYWLYALRKQGGAEQDLNNVWTYQAGTHAPPTTRAPTTVREHTHKVTPQTVTQKPQPHVTTEKPTGRHTDAPTGTNQNRDCNDAPVCTSYPCLVFDDEFNTLDMKTWEHEITAGGGGNWEFQWYTNNRSNSYVRDGTLYIKPTLTTDQYGPTFLQSGKLQLWGGGPHDTCTSNNDWGCERTGTPGNLLNPIQSARLRSSRGFNFKYGKVEIEAKLPKGDWLWPAIWMMPTWDQYGGWPTSGEIDIMESRGNRNYHDRTGQSQGVDHMGSTLHFGPDYSQNKWHLAHAEKDSKSGTFGDAFHKYGLEWTEDHLRFFVDDEEILKVDPGSGGFWKFGNFDKSGYNNPWANGSKMAPFDQEFYIILNVAVGGLTYFSDENTNAAYPKPWNAADQGKFWNARNLWYPTWNPDVNNGEDAAMKINYVKVWKLKP